MHPLTSFLSSFISLLAHGRQRAQAAVEYGLVVVGGALLAALGYTLFSPILQSVAQEVQRELGLLR
jgi:hypothetical protein